MNSLAKKFSPKQRRGRIGEDEGMREISKMKKKNELIITPLQFALNFFSLVFVNRSSTPTLVKDKGA